MIFCLHPDRRFAVAARSTLEMARRCRHIVCRKRIRRMETVSSSSHTELVGLRNETQALCERLRIMEQEKKQQEENFNRLLEEQRKGKDVHSTQRDDAGLESNSRFSRTALVAEASIRDLDLARNRDLQVLGDQLQAYHVQSQACQEELRIALEKQANAHALEKHAQDQE